jgi:hypothetical protein
VGSKQKLLDVECSRTALARCLIAAAMRVDAPEESSAGRDLLKPSTTYKTLKKPQPSTSSPQPSNLKSQTLPRKGGTTTLA